MATQSSKNGNPILNLDTLVDGPLVVIDGTEYSLLTWLRIPPLDNHRLMKYWQRVSEVTSQELTPEEEAELAALPNRMCRLVLRAPNEVHEKLDDLQRMAIVEAFLVPSRI